MGGLGLISSSSISEVAYVASLWEAGVSYSSEYCSSLVTQLRNQGVDLTVEQLQSPPPERKIQRWFTEQVMRGKVNSLLYSASTDDDVKGRIKSAQQTGASDWLRILPSSSSKTFTNEQWRLAARLRLGLKLSPHEPHAVCPLCNAPNPQPHHHPFTCPYVEMKKARTERHNFLRDSLAGAFSKWGIPISKELIIHHQGGLRGGLRVASS